jgi:hypothetical protein
MAETDWNLLFMTMLKAQQYYLTVHFSRNALQKLKKKITNFLPFSIFFWYDIFRPFQAVRAGQA